MNKAQIIGIYSAVCILIILIIIGITIGLSVKSKGLNQNPDIKSDSFVTYKSLGQNENLGDQLFQVAITLGAAKKLNRKVSFPKWRYASLFELPEDFFQEIDNDLKIIDIQDLQYKKDKFAHDVLVNIISNQQDPIYFNFIAHDIRRIFTFNFNLKSDIESNMKTRSVIGMHVEKKKNTDNDICDIDYYLAGIKYFRQKQPDVPIIIFADDKIWCQKNILPCVSNASISKFECEQQNFISLSLCQFKIISNSNFDWWAAWLDARFTSEVFRPQPWIDKKTKIYEDICLSDWHIFNVNDKKTYIKDNIVLNIGGYYQCYRQPHAFMNTCESFRRVYPTSSLVIVSDNGDNFSNAATYFNALSYKTNEKRGGNGVTTHIKSFDSIISFVLNFLQGAKQITETYFALLEDDVAIIRALQIPSSVCTDIIGNNGIEAQYKGALYNYFNGKKTYYGGCGGSLFRTSFWANLDIDKVKEQLSIYQNMCDSFHSDMVLSFICYSNGGSICCGQEIFKTEFTETIDFQRKKMPAVYHMYKELYNCPTTIREQKILFASLKRN